MAGEKKPARKVSETLQHVRFNRGNGLLEGERIGARACSCCGDILVFLVDTQDKPFVAIQIDTDTAFEFAGVLLRARDAAVAIKARLGASVSTKKGLH